MIPDEKLEEYFSAVITQPPSSSSSPMQQHQQIIEELQRPFSLEPVISARLEISLLKISEASDADILASLRQVCTNIALTVSDALSDYHRFKACRDDSLKALEELMSPKA